MLVWCNKKLFSDQEKCLLFYFDLSSFTKFNPLPHACCVYLNTRAQQQEVTRHACKQTFHLNFMLETHYVKGASVFMVTL